MRLSIRSQQAIAAFNERKAQRQVSHEAAQREGAAGREESGRPLCQLSRLLALSVG
jgi:hypothetical protein